MEETNTNPTQPTVPTTQPTVEQTVISSSTEMPPPVVSPPNPTPVEPPKPKSKTPLLAVLLILLLGIIGGGIYLFLQNQKPETPVNLPIFQESPSPTPDPTENWETYNSGVFKLSFKIPPKLIQNGQIKEKVSNAEKGTYLCITIEKNTGSIIDTVSAGGTGCNIGNFALQANSIGFEAGQMGHFTDIQGFAYKDGKYYYNWMLGTDYEATHEIPQNIVEPYSDNILKIKGKNYDSIAIWPSINQIGAIINTGNETYPGLIVLAIVDDNFTEKDFDQILSTFKFND